MVCWAAPQPVVIISSARARGAMAARIVAECGSVGLTTVQVIGPVAGSVGGPEPAALMKIHRARAVVSLPAFWSDVFIWRRRADGQIVAHAVPRPASRGEHALAIRVAERLRAELLPMDPDGVAHAMPMPATVTPVQSARLSERAIPSAAAIDGGSIPEQTATDGTTKSLGVGVMGHAVPGAVSVVFAGDWELGQQWKLRSHVIVGGSDHVYTSSANAWELHLVDLNWTMFSLGVLWIPAHEPDARVVPSVGWGLGVARFSATEVSPKYGSSSASRSTGRRFMAPAGASLLSGAPRSRSSTARNGSSRRAYPGSVDPRNSRR